MNRECRAGSDARWVRTCGDFISRFQLDHAADADIFDGNLSDAPGSPNFHACVVLHRFGIEGADRELVLVIGESGDGRNDETRRKQSESLNPLRARPFFTSLRNRTDQNVLLE